METKLIELLKLCIDKGLNISIDNICKTVTVMLLDYETREWIVYDYVHFGVEVYDDVEENIKMNENNVFELIEKVKNYKK